MLQLDNQDIHKVIGSLRPAQRKKTALEIGKLLKHGKITTDELPVVLGLVDQLVSDTAVEVRRAIAESAAMSSHLPAEVIHQIANDVDEVSLPVIKFSKLLNDDDLLETLPRGEAFQLAVGSRDNVPAKLVEQIVEIGSEKAVANVISNEGAELTERATKIAITRFKKSVEVIQAITGRPKLSKSVVEVLLSFSVGEHCVGAIARLLVERLISGSDIPPYIINELVSRARDKVIKAISEIKHEIDIPDFIANELKADPKISASKLMQAIATGNMELFLKGMTAATEQPPERVEKVIVGLGDDAFRKLYDTSHLPGELFQAFSVGREMLRKPNRTRRGGLDVDALIEKIEAAYKGLSMPALDELMASLRQLRES